MLEVPDSETNMIRTALVTGSTSGIGLGVAQDLARRGYNVILNGFGDPNPALEQVRACQANTASKVGFVEADLSKAEDCRRLVAQSAEIFGNSRLDVVVNNAGIQHVSPVVSFPEEQWDRIIQLNLNSVFHMSKAALPLMTKHREGRIINIASVHGLVASANKSAYVAAKHGVVGFTKTLALELAAATAADTNGAPLNITANCVCPGWVLTPLVDAQIKAKAEKEGLSYENAKKVLVGEKMPSGIPATVEEIANAVAFFAEIKNRSTNGVMLNVDGGWVSQ